MKEEIYTIPVTDAFNEVSECPICVLENKLENQYIEYFLGPSLMEPDCRIETNDKGFCKRHFELLYNRQENRLGLGLTIDTHLFEQNKILNKKLKRNLRLIKGEHNIPSLKTIFKRYPSSAPIESFINELSSHLKDLEKKCAICDKMEFTMNRYFDVIFYLWTKEKEFRNLFISKKGFCLTHFRQLLDGSKKHLNIKYLPTFIENLLKMQLENMERLQNEVNWFTQKFDYRNADAPWGNSKDAVQRSIEKIVGYSDLV